MVHSVLRNSCFRTYPRKVFEFGLHITSTTAESGSSLKRKVVSMYLAGYNIMHWRSKTGRINPSQRDAVREVVRRNLVGTEIIADASDLITIQVLLSLPELSVNAAVRSKRVTAGLT